MTLHFLSYNMTRWWCHWKKRPWVLPGQFLFWHHHRVILYITKNHKLPPVRPLTFIQPKYPMNSNMVKIGTIRSGVCLLKGSTVENEIFKCGKASSLLNSSGTARYCDPKLRWLYVIGWIWVWVILIQYVIPYSREF